MLGKKRERILGIDWMNESDKKRNIILYLLLSLLFSLTLSLSLSLKKIRREK
jgi:hypothetical protein